MSLWQSSLSPNRLHLLPFQLGFGTTPHPAITAEAVVPWAEAGKAHYVFSMAFSLWIRDRALNYHKACKFTLCSRIGLLRKFRAKPVDNIKVLFPVLLKWFDIPPLVQLVQKGEYFPSEQRLIGSISERPRSLHVPGGPKEIIEWFNGQILFFPHFFYIRHQFGFLNDRNWIQILQYVVVRVRLVSSADGRAAGI